MVLFLEIQLRCTILTTSYNYNDRLSSEPIFKDEKPIPKTPTENEWKCPKCGKINQNYVGTCGCGTNKPVVNK